MLSSLRFLMKNKIGRSTGKGRGGLRSAIYYILRGHCTHLHSETKKKKKNNELLRVAVDDWPSAFATAADASDSTEASPETRCFDHCYTATEESIAQCTKHEAHEGTIDRRREMENRLEMHAIAPPPPTTMPVVAPAQKLLLRKLGLDFGCTAYTHVIMLHTLLRYYYAKRA